VIRRTCRYCDHTASHTLFVVMADGGSRCKSGAACARRMQARPLEVFRQERHMISFTCPVCSRRSYNHQDVVEGYCSNCHAWTGRGS
jgi:hypothetical protein